jgi:hypothetical protein
LNEELRQLNDKIQQLTDKDTENNREIQRLCYFPDGNTWVFSTLV